jgi:hypothetical protein
MFCARGHPRRLQVEPNDVGCPARGVAALGWTLVLVEPSREELEAAHCWEADDRVSGRPAMTGFRRRTRYHQAQWREAHGHPIGTQPIVPRPGVAVRPVGSRVPLDYGRTTGAGFVSPAALGAARARTSFVEREQSFDHQRLWADLLSSEALSFNLFGDLFADMGWADRAVHRWWPDTPGSVREIRFAHSPGRLDPSYLNSLRAFDAAFVLDTGGSTRGVVAVDVKFFERNKIEQPKPSNAARNMDVCERSHALRPRSTVCSAAPTWRCSGSSISSSTPCSSTRAASGLGVATWSCTRRITPTSSTCWRATAATSLTTRPSRR